MNGAVSGSASAITPKTRTRKNQTTTNAPRGLRPLTSASGQNAKKWAITFMSAEWPNSDLLIMPRDFLDAPVGDIGDSSQTRQWWSPQPRKRRRLHRYRSTPNT